MTESVRNSTMESEDVGSVRRFSDFNIASDVLESLAGMGINTPTPIQEACIPAILEGRDVIGKAETGTGKTIGFGAPLVGRIDTQRVAVQALVLTPTRELAQQVAGVIELLGARRGLGVVLVVGGVHASEQILKLRSGSQVVVGTPGRVLDFLRERTLSLVWCETVVLDEADRMLDMGFIDDVTAILERIPKERQTLLFSATIPPEINKLLKRYMRNPAQFSTSQGLSTVSDIRQFYVEAEYRNKFRVLERILQSHVGATVIIFCNTRRQAIDLDRMMWGHSYSSGSLHGDQEQDVRFKILESFRRGDIKILVATDVASRGLDVEDVACVVNYEIPDEPESYVHRIGRTGRAQRSGEAISIVAEKEFGSWQRILKQTGFKVERWGVERGSSDGVARAPRPQENAQRPLRPSPRHGVEAERELQVHRPQKRGGERSMAQENENTDVTPQGGETPAGKNQPQRPGPRTAGAGQADEGGDRRHPRRRRRGGGGGGGGGRGGNPDGGESRHPSQRVHQPQPPAAPAQPRRPPPGPSESPGRYAEDDDVPTPEETQKWLSERPRTEAPKQQRIKLDELDDGYLKTDYFDVDLTLVERAGPPPKPRQPTGGRGEPPRVETRSEGGRSPERGPPGPRPARPHGAQPRPEARAAGEPPRSSGGRQEGHTQPGAQQATDAGEGQRRRRRRRRGRGRGHGGAPEGGGSREA